MSEYTGTPEEVGAHIAMDALAPTLVEVAKTCTDEQVVRMMAGMLGAITGLVSDNFGPAITLDMLSKATIVVHKMATEAQAKVN